MVTKFICHYTNQLECLISTILAQAPQKFNGKPKNGRQSCFNSFLT